MKFDIPHKYLQKHLNFGRIFCKSLKKMGLWDETWHVNFKISATNSQFTRSQQRQGKHRRDA